MQYIRRIDLIETHDISLDGDEGVLDWEPNRVFEQVEKYLLKTITINDVSFF